MSLTSHLCQDQKSHHRFNKVGTDSSGLGPGLCGRRVRVRVSRSEASSAKGSRDTVRVKTWELREARESGCWLRRVFRAHCGLSPASESQRPGLAVPWAWIRQRAHREERCLRSQGDEEQVRGSEVSRPLSAQLWAAPAVAAHAARPSPWIPGRWHHPPLRPVCYHR